MRRLSRILLLPVLLAGSGSFTITWAQIQEPAVVSKVAPRGPDSDELVPVVPDASIQKRPVADKKGVRSKHRGMRLIPKVRTVVDWVNEPIPESEVADAEVFAKIVQTLKSAPEGPLRQAAANKLQAHLEKAFARDLERREKEFAEVEARVKKLREQIEKRKKMKEAIVKLRLMTIVNETDGLEFPTPFGEGAGMPRGVEPKFQRWYYDVKPGAMRERSFPALAAPVIPLSPEKGREADSPSDPGPPTRAPSTNPTNGP